jgi:hypothetical protein
MKVFSCSWRQLLAATALLAAVLGPAASDASIAAAAEGQPEREHYHPGANARRLAQPEREGAHGEAKREREAERPEAREGDRPEMRREGEHERRPAPSPERMEQRRQLEEKAGDLRRKLDSLRPDQADEARELRAVLERIEAELRGGPPPRDADDRGPLMARLEEIKAAIQRAREAGNREQVELLERKAREVHEQLGPRQHDQPRPEGQAEEIQRRMQHLRVAIENLRAAGLNAQADALAGEAERWMRERELPPRHPPEGRERPDMPPMVHFERAIHEIHQQLDELRRQLDELRRHMHELSEQVRR